MSTSNDCISNTHSRLRGEGPCPWPQARLWPEVRHTDGSYRLLPCTTLPTGIWRPHYFKAILCHSTIKEWVTACPRTSREISWDHFPVPIRARHQKMCSGGAESSCTRRLVRILVSLMVLVIPFYPLGRRCDPWCASNQVLSVLRSSSSTTCMSGCIPVVCDTLVEHRRSCIGSSTHYFGQTLADEELLWEAYAEAVGGHSLISESGPRGLVGASDSAHVGVPIFYTGHAHAGSTTLTLWVSWVLFQVRSGIRVRGCSHGNTHFRANLRMKWSCVWHDMFAPDLRAPATPTSSGIVQRYMEVLALLLAPPTYGLQRTRRTHQDRLTVQYGGGVCVVTSKINRPTLFDLT